MDIGGGGDGVGGGGGDCALLGPTFSLIHFIFVSKAPQHIIELNVSIEKLKISPFTSLHFFFIKKMTFKKSDFRSL